MSNAVLESSAILALLLAEEGAAKLAATLPGALISTVNIAEIITKLCERGMPAIQAKIAIETIGVEVIDFTREHACLALAQIRNVPALTADTAWSALHGFHIVMIQ